mmetsp:Transcript_9019/g.14309  ORF Transcript_9019/g.14309 Transcript_9019/m.14309 type:complete len:320 (+) Transcript_9019:55-1014(+)
MALSCALAPRILLSHFAASASNSASNSTLHPRRRPNPVPVHVAIAARTAGFSNALTNCPRAASRADAGATRSSVAAVRVSASTSGVTSGGGDCSSMAPGVPNDFAGFNKVASSVAAERNKAPIADAIVPYLARAAAGGVLLEVACGTGQHAGHLAPLLPHLILQPTDLDNSAFDAVTHYSRGHANVRAPLILDAASDWVPRLLSTLAAGGGGGGGTVAAVLAVNVTHISPLAATRGLITGASAVLSPGAHLFIYGPFTRGGAHTSQSNAEFDTSLQGRNPEWGYRDVEAVVELATAAGMSTEEVRDMPANNFMLVFTKL